ncbi:cingulin-like protein 1 isoform X2 [Paramisgurnus dabryanus]|uniref:cingulin-like protein 1 isoform X2 n=1 Tax=Paramisgurnus dabryanus TaxID=90735 RepID=UPI0031F394C0
MESYSSDSGDERSDPAQESQNFDSGSFGVKVQVQGINGRPYVVLNGQGKTSPEYPDVFLMDHQQQALLSYMSGSASSTQTPRTDFRSLRTRRNASTQLLNCQKSPEILKTYDLRNNSLNIAQSPPYHRNTVTESGEVCMNASPVMVKRARIPLPAVGQERELSVDNPPSQTSDIICSLSVPASVDDPTENMEQYSTRPNHRESPRVSRVDQRSRARPEDKGRSRSAATISGLEMEVESFPDSTDVSTVVRQQNEVRSPRSTGQQKKVKTERSKATPDLLKGQQELPDHPDEKKAKLVMFNYLKERSSDDEDVIRQKVDVIFQKINMLKSRTTLETLEELADRHTEVNDLKDRRAALENEISYLKQQLQQANKKSEEKQERLQEELERSQQEQLELRHRLTDMEKDLQSSLDQLLQAKRARDQCRADMRDLQQQLSDIHDELDTTKSSDAGERDRLLQDLSELREEFQALQEVYEEQGDALLRRERELMALQGALEEEKSAHVKDVETLKETHQQEVQKLLEATEEAKESLEVLRQKVLEVAAEKSATQIHICELSRTKAELQEKIKSLEEQIISLNETIQQRENQTTLLEQHVDQLTMEKQNLEVELMEIKQQEEEMCGANRALMRHLEDTQSELSRLNRAHRELKERLQEESKQMGELQKRKSDLEEERKNQNRVFEHLQEEMNAVVLGSERETQRLQDEVDTIRDQNWRELDALHTQLHNTQTQLQTQTQAAQEYQRERCVLEEKLSHCEFDLNEATKRTEELQKRIQQLEENKHTHEEKQLNLMEVKVFDLEQCLMEERRSSDVLMKTLERGREQIEQARTDLLQERSARQDLECDKISLERQNKDLRGRVSQLEASQRTGADALLIKLQLNVQELEEKLLEEEKENSDLQQQNRKLERKMKEVKLLQEEERLSLQDQRDQLMLRLKSLKRLLDEAEEEIQRLENSKKKLQRDVDEQQELNDQLQTQLSALRIEIRRDKRSNTLQATDEDDEDERAVSSD